MTATSVYDENKWVLVMLWNPFCLEHVDRKINLATMIFSNFLSNLELHFFTVDCFSDRNFDWNLKEFHSNLVLQTEKFNVYTQARHCHLNTYRKLLLKKSK